MFKQIREYENLHIALWLLKDTCWALLWKPGGIIMLIPTFSVAVHIAYRSRKNIHELFHNIAVCLWITANGIWMIGEFFYDDGLRNHALFFFCIGILVMFFYYTYHFPKKHKNTTHGI